MRERGFTNGMIRSGLVLLLVVCLAGFVQATEPGNKDTPKKNKCPTCGMFTEKFADWNARVEFKDGTSVTFDGSKCMFKFYLETKKRDEIKAIYVKDYVTKKDIDAKGAYYVIWADLYGPMGHEPIPFEKESEAKKFQKEHKGKKTIKFKDINARLLHALDNPP